MGSKEGRRFTQHSRHGEHYQHTAVIFLCDTKYRIHGTQAIAGAAFMTYTSPATNSTIVNNTKAKMPTRRPSFVFYRPQEPQQPKTGRKENYSDQQNVCSRHQVNADGACEFWHEEKKTGNHRSTRPADTASHQTPRAARRAA